MVDPHRLWITLAHAGKRDHVLDSLVKTQDHPRACGEKINFISTNAAIKGSPPRMRGKVERAVERHADMRITPAHAGKRSAT